MTTILLNEHDLVTVMHRGVLWRAKRSDDGSTFTLSFYDRSQRGWVQSPFPQELMVDLKGYFGEDE